MDPVTHGILGAAVSHALFSRHLGKGAWLAGCAGALLPDLDILIRSPADPFLALDFHRHFTHSLIFIPAGGLLASLPWILQRKFQSLARWFVQASTAGYATHSLLDTCTSYGTRLLWPFFDWRISLDIISIVDPVFTILLAAGTVLAVKRNKENAAALALVFCSLYLALGAVQQERGEIAQEQIALSRHSAVERSRLIPMVGNNIVWRSLYLSRGKIFADRIRINWAGDVSWTPGIFAAAFPRSAIDASFSENSRIDLERFRCFSTDWLGYIPGQTDAVGDMRYSTENAGFKPLWAVRIIPGREKTVQFLDNSSFRAASWSSYWSELTGDEHIFTEL